MNRNSLFPIMLITLILLSMFPVSFVSAQPLPIGDPGYIQTNPFDSTPQAGGTSGTGTLTGTIDLAFDGYLATNLNWIYGATANGFVNVTNFKKPSDNGLTDFAITFIDIKVDYRLEAISTTNDEYRIVFYFGGNTYDLQPWIAGRDGFWAGGTSGSLPGIRTFSNVPKPGGGAWLWSDIVDLKVGIENRVVDTSDGRTIYLHEIWITAYSSPYPSSGTMSVRPSAILDLHTDDLFYVDIYVTGVAKMWGYELVLTFDPTVLAGIEYLSYGPFVSPLPSVIGEDYVAVAYKTYDGDPTGFTGSTPIARIYFVVVADGTSTLTLAKATGANIFGNTISFVAKNGVFASNPVHDVAVTDVTVNATNVVPGQLLEINATFMNQGTYNEAVDVTAFYDTTSIDTQTIIDVTPGLTEIVTFIWDTTGISVGFYQIKAEASVPIDDNPSNNVNVWGVVPEGLLVGRHDIAVTEIMRAYANDTVVPTGSLLNVTRGDIVHINVTVENLGHFPETFNLTLMWYDKYGIENKTNVSLDPGVSKNLTFVWNTDITYPPWEFDLDRWGRPQNFSRGDVRAVATPDWSTGVIEAKGVPYEKGDYVYDYLDYDYTGNNDLTDGEVRVNRDLRFPTAQFYVSPLNLYVGQPAKFDGGPPSYSKTPIGTTIVEYRWDFGDGNVTIGNYPTIYHAYSNVGNYSVKLFVINSIGLNDTVETGQSGAPSSKVKVTVRNVKLVNIEVSPTTAAIGENVTIRVTVKNEGVNDESLAGTKKNLTVYYGDSVAVRVRAPDLGAVGSATNTTTLVLNWTTTGLSPGVHTIKAVLDDLGYETSTSDNTVIFAEQVTLLWHNIKVTGITVSKSEATVGDSVTISVTVVNQGNFTETFTVTAYANGTAIGDAQTVSDLAAGASRVVDFSWNTADLDSGVYVFRAVASNVTLEAVTGDNVYDGGSVTLSPASNMLLYIIIGAAAVIVVLALVGVYFLKFRKPK